MYPVYDVMDEYAGNKLLCEDVDLLNGTKTLRAANLPGLLPGCVRTYKTNVTNNPTTWHGNYQLYAQIDKLVFSMGTNDSDTVFTAQRQGDGNFVITYTDASGTLQTLDNDDGLLYHARNASSLKDNDNQAAPI